MTGQRIPSLRGKKVAVTGGAGFIGSSLVRQLAAAGADVTVIDNLINGKRENLDGVTGGAVVLEVADIRDEARLADLVAGADIVYHLACLGIRHSLHEPLENHDVNATATLTVLMAARQGGAERFVHVSSSEVYGTARTVPMSEDHPTLATTVYGASKLAGESYARAFYTAHGYPTVVVRPFNAFGPRCHHEGDSGEVIPKFLLRCLAGRRMVVFGDGTQTRDFTYVNDIARGILLAGIAERAVGETINLGSGREISINDLAREVARVARRNDALVEHDDPRPGDVRRLCADARKARDILGFAPTVSLADGLADLCGWYRAQGKSPDELLEDEAVRNWAAPAV